MISKHFIVDRDVNWTMHAGVYILHLLLRYYSIYRASMHPHCLQQLLLPYLYSES